MNTTECHLHADQPIPLFPSSAMPVGELSKFYHKMQFLSSYPMKRIISEPTFDYSPNLLPVI